MLEKMLNDWQKNGIQHAITSSYTKTTSKKVLAFN